MDLHVFPIFTSIDKLSRQKSIKKIYTLNDTVDQNIQSFSQADMACSPGYNIYLVTKLVLKSLKRLKTYKAFLTMMA